MTSEDLQRALDAAMRGAANRASQTLKESGDGLDGARLAGFSSAIKHGDAVVLVAVGPDPTVQLFSDLDDLMRRLHE